MDQWKASTHLVQGPSAAVCEAVSVAVCGAVSVAVGGSPRQAAPVNDK